MRYLVSAALAAALSLSVFAQENHHSHAHGHAHEGMEGHGDHAIGTPSGYTRRTVRYEVPDLRLTDSTGQRVAVGELLAADRPVIMSFIFTSCTAVCPVISATVAQARNTLHDDGGSPIYVSVSIDPEYDTPKRLREYAARHHAGSDWTFLTGSAEDVQRLQRAFDAFRGDKMNHAPAIYLRNGKDEPWVRLDGFTSARDLVREYRTLRGG